MFGLKGQAMIQGLAFMRQQIGSLLGAYGGGLIYDSLGSCTHGLAIVAALENKNGAREGPVQSETFRDFT